MMPDIFSSFDSYEFNILLPQFMFNLIIMSLVIYTSSILWMKQNKFFSFVALMKNTIFAQLMRTYSKLLKGFTLIISSIFSIIIIMNTAGLIPYTFSMTTHLVMTLGLGLPLWAALVISSALNNPKKFIAHLLPDGAPTWLNPFLVMIETTSILVRPITLSFRLAANMSAGHVVLSLVGSYMAPALFNNMSSFIILSLFSSAYILFEVAISFIQGYIFCLLISLYSDEHTY